MKEQIIYYDKLRGCYCVTSRENYEERITNARAVIQCSDFASAEQVRDYLVNHGYGTKDQYTIIPQEEEQ